MKTIVLVLALAAMAYSQTSGPDTVCAALRLQNLNTECSQQVGDLLSLDVTTFCAGQCATAVRQIYTDCRFSDVENPINLFCNGAILAPDVSCLAPKFQQLTSCLTLLSGDPTAFCTSQCATDVTAAYTQCGFTGTTDPITVLCGANINLTTFNPVCLSARLSSLSNCALELVASPTAFCTTQCAVTVSSAFNECGFTGDANVVTTLCSGGVPIQDPLCASKRLQNLQGCVSSFLTNVSLFCDSPCSDALVTAYNDCGYTNFNNPVMSACSSLPSVGGDTLCLTSRLQQLNSCVREITENATNFCTSNCRTRISDAYIDCGFPGDNLTAGICSIFPSNGPDSICLGERLTGLSSCVNTFLTQPTSFCTSACYTDLNAAYNDCGYTGPLNPLSAGCTIPAGQDPLCLSRQLINLDDCFLNILTNQSAFCNSDCRTRVSDAFTRCGYPPESDLTAVCNAPAGTTPAVEQCLATRLQTVQGCLTQFTQNPINFCSGQCARDVRAIYSECGYETQFGDIGFNLTNPVDDLCGGSASTQGALCLVYGLLDQTQCLAVLLSNSSQFCTSECRAQVSSVYNGCGLSGPSNPVELSCSAPTPAQDPVCLSTSLQSELACLGQLLTDRGTFCTSDCSRRLSSAYNRCGYTGFANPVVQSCNNTAIPVGPDTCLSSSTVFQNCLAELSLNPNSFCTSNCVTNINSLFMTCGIPPEANPTTTFCSGLLPDIPGQPSPVCLARGLGNLQDCVATITANPANFCGSRCAFDLSAAYNECGFVNSSNPVTLLCNATPTGTGDLVCLTAALSNAQNCITQLATDPSSFCSSQCSMDLSTAYTSCGFIQSANPVSIACGGGLPGQDPFCISGKLTSLQDCTAKLNNQDFCGSECDSDLRTAYSECGFTGTTNPVAILCSGANNGPNTICLGTQLQLHQECVSELFNKPTDICSSTSECTTTIQNAYSMCGYQGTNNPLMTTCSGSQTGGADQLASSMLALFVLLVMALAAIFY